MRRFAAKNSQTVEATVKRESLWRPTVVNVPELRGPCAEMNCLFLRGRYPASRRDCNRDYKDSKTISHAPAAACGGISTRETLFSRVLFITQSAKLRLY